MKDYSIQNFTFTKGRIFPNDWLQTEPYTCADEVDRYYVSLANRVADTLKASSLAPAFDAKDDLLKAALTLTGWFEDICSGTCIWRVVNDECKKRYGALLPFYALEDYYPGEVNWQDLALLLWDIVQSEHAREGRIMNPENPATLEVAHELCDFFDSEYETAPVNERLYEFVHNPAASSHIWEARGLMSWFHYRSFIGHRGTRVLHQTIEDEGVRFDGYEIASRMLYEYSTTLTFHDRSNILSLSTPHWLSRIRGGDAAFEDIKSIENRLYRFQSFDATGMRVEDMIDGRELVIDAESFDMRTFNPKVYKSGESVLSLSVLVFGGKHYMCGTMACHPFDSQLRHALEEQKNLCALRDLQPSVYEDFMKASDGEPFLLMADADEMNSFFVGKMKKSLKAGVTMPDHIREHKNFIMSADPVAGIISAPDLASCISAPGNKLYDREYARKNGINFFVNPNALNYRLACTVQDLNFVPDAYMNSINGEDYGRRFLHANGRFITDYFFNCCRQYEFGTLTGHL